MQLEYQIVDQVLRQHSIGVNAANFHGKLSALICLGWGEDESDDWLPVLAQGGFLSDNQYLLLKSDTLEIFQNVRDELNSQGFEYRILLPDETHPMKFRVETIASWCQGFMEVMALFGDYSPRELADVCYEFIEDVQNIAEIELDEGESAEENEAAYFTVEQHLRVGVQLVYETLNFPSDTDIFNEQR